MDNLKILKSTIETESYKHIYLMQGDKEIGAVTIRTDGQACISARLYFDDVEASFYIDLTKEPEGEFLLEKDGETTKVEF